MSWALPYRAPDDYGTAVDPSATTYAPNPPPSPSVSTGQAPPVVAQPKTFPHARYDALVEETVANLKKLGQLKGGEYAGDTDRLANFRRNAEPLGLPMEAVWHTYAMKHVDAVTQYIRDLIEGKTRERMEPLSGRLDDIIVYCILFKAMLLEREDG